MISRTKSVIFSGLFSVLLLSVVGIILYSAEKSLLAKGIRPGYLEINDFHKVDSLIEIPRMIGDGHGIYKANPDYYNNPDYVEMPRINSDGFRSLEFLKREGRDTAIFCVGLIGDSFTWGSSAKPLKDCFADLLRNKTKYYVDNMGIPGSDLHQYYLLANWYVPNYKPDFLYVILSCGDLTYHIRETIPFHPIYYFTNAGMLTGTNQDSPFQVFNTASESYEYYLNNFTPLLGENRNFFFRFMRLTAIGTHFFKILFPYQFNIDYSGLEPKSWWYFDKIDSICTANDVIWNLVLIPCEESFQQGGTNDAGRMCFNHCNEHFRSHKFLKPPLSKEDYVDGPDNHTNNSGHRKIFEFLKNNLDSLIHQKLNKGILQETKIKDEE